MLSQAVPSGTTSCTGEPGQRSPWLCSALSTLLVASPYKVSTLRILSSPPGGACTSLQPTAHNIELTTWRSLSFPPANCSPSSRTALLLELEHCPVISLSVIVRQVHQSVTCSELVGGHPSRDRLKTLSCAGTEPPILEFSLTASEL